MAVSDVTIRSAIRQVLARHWIDTKQLKFECCRGVIRFRGRLSRIGERDELAEELPLFDILEQEIKKISGVRKVYFMGVKLDQSYT